MKLKLTRRQFGQLAVASTAAATVGFFANKTVGQQPPNSKILGARVGSISDDDTDTNLNSETTDLADGSATADIVPSSLQTIVVESFEVGTPEVRPVLTTAPTLEAGEQISGFAALSGGILVVATTILNAKNKGNTYLITLGASGASPTRQVVTGLKKQETLLSLFTRKDGSLGGVVGKINGTPPMSIVSINPQTAAITGEDKLSGNLRVNTVAECPDATLYGIVTNNKGETSLVQIDKGKDQTTPLRFEGQLWNNGFNSLVCSSSNELFALGARRYEAPLFLHSINKNTGVITRIRDFNVAKIAIQI
ncbi:MAG: hypothetical protein KME57_13610 [Scytonema hyalinum WJT4-NPBG1]|jgi:hypothetical protein|nr:hypothetical protein [Scytonema hyalinum WJT4-NPBG1]